MLIDMLPVNIESIASDFNNKINRGASTYDLLRVAAHFRRLELEKILYSKLNGFIVDGPFKGMSYLPLAHASTLTPKLLGIYEKEIQSDLLTIAKSADSFLDVGCAEGYYTTGLALLPNITSIIGIDINDESLKAAIKLAEINHIYHKTHFTTNIGNAVKQLQGQTLIMIDVDGAEIEVIKEIFLFAPEKLLLSTTFLVETDYHKDGRSNKNEILIEFQRNDFELIKEIKQDPSCRISRTSQRYTQSFLDLAILGMEGRPMNQSWVIFKHK